MVSKNIFVNIDLDCRGKGYESTLIPVLAHHRLVKHYSSPWLPGVEPSEALLELVMLMFNREEAEVVQHLPPLRPKTLRKFAGITRRPESDLS